MGEVVTMGGTSRCTCMEVHGEDPCCPLHGLTAEGIAAWTDADCMIAGEIDAFTVRRLIQSVLTTPRP